MAYRVELAKNAEAELEELYLWVVERAPNQGAAWFNGLEQAILSLERLPKRCRIAPERFDPDQPVRVLNYGRSPHVYRVFFTRLAVGEGHDHEQRGNQEGQGSRRADRQQSGGNQYGEHRISGVRDRRQRIGRQHGQTRRLGEPLMRRLRGGEEAAEQDAP